MYRDNFGFRSHAHRWSPSSEATRSEDIIVSESRESIVVSSEDKFRHISEWPDLADMCMSRELEIDSSFCDFFDLSRRMKKQDRRYIFIEIWKFLYDSRNIFFLTTFWIIDTDNLESIDIYEFVFENVDFCIFERLECSCDTKIRLMISSDIVDSFRSLKLIDWIDEMFEKSVHSIVEISCDNYCFRLDFIDLCHDSSEEFITDDVSEMDIGYLYDSFSFPVFWKIFECDVDISDSRIIRIPEAISRDTDREDYRTDSEDIRWNIQVEKFSNSENNPHKQKSKEKIGECSEPASSCEIETTSQCSIPIMSEC